MKGHQAKRTQVEIDNHEVVKAFCASRGISMRAYVNHLIRDDVIRHGDVNTSVSYFKGKQHV